MQHHKIFRLNATLIIFRVALSFTFHKIHRYCTFLKFLLDFFQKYDIIIHVNEIVSLAQLVEQLTLNQWVWGSSPQGDTILVN